MTCPHNNTPCTLCWMLYPCKLNTQFVFLIKHQKAKRWLDDTVVKKCKTKSGKTYTYFYDREEMREKRRIRESGCTNGENG